MDEEQRFTAHTGFNWRTLDNYVTGGCGRLAEIHGEPPAKFRQLREHAALADVVEVETWFRVAEARSGGASWTEIGQALGISRQAARMRFRGADKHAEYLASKAAAAAAEIEIGAVTMPTDEETEQVWATATGPASAAPGPITDQKGLPA